MELFDTLLYSRTGNGEVFSTDPLEIPGIEGERPLTLYLPPDYLTETDRYYPIAYLFDGQNLYDRSAWPLGWNLHHLLDERAAEGLDVPIVVGLHHGANRDEELCPWPAERGQTPRGDTLLDWIVDELHPQLAAQLRIDDQPEARMVGGSSLGGLLALYAGFRHSHFFGKVMAMSPSLWVGDGAIYNYIAEAAFLHNIDFLRLYIDCGALEADEWSEDFWDEAETDPERLNKTESDPKSKPQFEPSDKIDQVDELIDDLSDPDSASNAIETDEDAVEDLDTDLAADIDEELDEDIDEELEDDWETDPLEDAEYLIDILRAKGFVEGLHFQWIADPEGEHNEWHWSKRLPLAFAYLFDAPHAEDDQIDEETEDDSDEADEDEDYSEDYGD
ncbi:MAG: hypothetical protein CVV27_09065 [Candidatus Melainabacteria bacterium HGW-Melainabacteria-1]|nr:MAG: hypothetical protein CVV27_09065 [Candidatus Melainabacteria bacterium HGW-Melainabacteria-1]